MRLTENENGRKLNYLHFRWNIYVIFEIKMCFLNIIYFPTDFLKIISFTLLLKEYKKFEIIFFLHRKYRKNYFSRNKIFFKEKWKLLKSLKIPAVKIVQFMRFYIIFFEISKSSNRFCQMFEQQFSPKYFLWSGKCFLLLWRCKWIYLKEKNIQ